MTRRCSELDVSPLLTQPLHSDVKLLELVLKVGLEGREIGGDNFVVLTIGAGDGGDKGVVVVDSWFMQGIDIALLGTGILSCDIGTLAQRDRFSFGVVVVVASSETSTYIIIAISFT